MAKKKTRNAAAILHARYVKDDVRRKASLAQQRINVQVARLIHDMRIEAGLTQAQLAKLVGTTQSVISRLEDSDYERHSLSMLNRIAEALKRRLTLTVAANDRMAS